MSEFDIKLSYISRFISAACCVFRPKSTRRGQQADEHNKPITINEVASPIELDQRTELLAPRPRLGQGEAE